jgi:hypothetical protein
MDIRNSSVEPFARFMRFTEAHGKVVKVTYGALENPKNEQPDVNGLVFVPTGGEPWGDGAHTKWKDVRAVAKVAGGFLAHMSLIYIMSAFEDLLIGIKAEYDRYVALGATGTGTQLGLSLQSENEPHSMITLMDQLGWSQEPIRYLLPLLKYFVVARNCIAHRSGRASSEMQAWSVDHHLLECIADWRTTTGKRPAKLPVVELGESIPLLPRHAIFAAEVCYRAAKHLNEKCRDRLGVDGVVYMAAHHSLLAPKPIRVAGNTEARVIKHALGDRYFVQDLKDADAEIIEILRRLGKWTECVRRYRKLRG